MSVEAWFIVGVVATLYAAAGIYTAFLAGGAAYRHASESGFWVYLLGVAIAWPIVWWAEPRR